VFFQQPAGQGVAKLAGPVLSLGKSDKAVLAVGPEHLIESPAGLPHKVPTPSLQFI